MGSHLGWAYKLEVASCYRHLGWALIRDTWGGLLDSRGGHLGSCSLQTSFFLAPPLSSRFSPSLFSLSPLSHLPHPHPPSLPPSSLSHLPFYPKDFNTLYVYIVEERLAEALTSYKQIDEGEFIRRSNTKSVWAPVSFPGQSAFWKLKERGSGNETV